MTLVSVYTDAQIDFDKVLGSSTSLQYVNEVDIQLWTEDVWPNLQAPQSCSVITSRSSTV